MTDVHVVAGHCKLQLMMISTTMQQQQQLLQDSNFRAGPITQEIINWQQWPPCDIQMILSQLQVQCLCCSWQLIISNCKLLLQLQLVKMSSTAAAHDLICAATAAAAKDLAFRNAHVVLMLALSCWFEYPTAANCNFGALGVIMTSSLFFSQLLQPRSMS
ncbi:unnamed protein product [Sphagnum balticum]